MLLKIGQVLKSKGLYGEIKVTFFYSKITVKENDVLFFEKDGNIIGSYKVLYAKHYKTDKDGKNIYLLKLDNVKNVTESNILTKSVIKQET